MDLKDLNDHQKSTLNKVSEKTFRYTALIQQVENSQLI